MPRPGHTHTLVASTANAYQRIGVDTAQTITLERDCVALLLAAEGQKIYIQFDDSTPSATNGLPVVAAAQPIYAPLGRLANANSTLKAIGAIAGGFLHVTQLA